MTISVVLPMDRERVGSVFRSKRYIIYQGCDDLLQICLGFRVPPQGLGKKWGNVRLRYS